MKFRIELGTTARCRVTGFTGIVTGRTNYISGCDLYLLQPPVDKDGKFVESRWFDDPRLLVTSEERLSVDERVDKTGADGEAPRK
jgi:hypothetical protein